MDFVPHPDRRVESGPQLRLPAPRRVTIVSPVFNEEDVLPLFLAALAEALPPLEARWDVRFDLLFVDDGSRDRSFATLAGASPLAFPMRLVRLSRNFGKEAALAAGLERATESDAVVLMDCDLQHPPALIDTMLEHWLQDGYDVVYTVKTSRKAEGIGKTQFANVFYWLVNSGGRFTIPRDAEDFRLLSARAAAAMRSLSERERLMKGLYAWIGFRQIAIPFDKPQRARGQSGFPPFRLFLLAIDGITAFTVAPLRVMSLVGILISSLSFLYGIIIIFNKILLGIPVPGLASTLVMISFFGGLHLLCLGLIGEYVGRTLIEAKHRPLYLIESEIERSADSAVSRGGARDRADPAPPRLEAGLETEGGHG